MNFDWLWPVLSNSSDSEQVDESLKIDIKRIKGGLQKSNQGIVLDEARRLYDQEQERRNSADTKAGVYIAVSAALVAILLPFVNQLVSENRPLFINVTGSLLVLMSIVQLVRSGLWAHKALKVSVYHQMDWRTLLKPITDSDMQYSLNKELLCSVRKNYDITNTKVTYIKMTQTLLSSAAVWLLISIIFQISFSIWEYEVGLDKDVGLPTPDVYICSSCDDIA